MNRLIVTLALLFAMVWSGFAQEKITGKVISSKDGVGIPGVSVVEKGTTNGVATDVDGNYSITVPNGAVLQFSYIGFKTQYVTINGGG